jgi:mediator of RNA polymerase II transcription subunit 22
VQIKDKDKVRIAQEAFQAQFRAESMVCISSSSNCFLTRRCLKVRATNSLLSIIHSMKLLLLLSDQSQIVKRRDAELLDTEKDKNELKKQVTEVLNDLLRRSGSGPSSSM